MKNIEKKIWMILPVMGLIIWGVLSITNNLWYDEAYFAALISRNFIDLIKKIGRAHV